MNIALKFIKATKLTKAIAGGVTGLVLIGAPVSTMALSGNSQDNNYYQHSNVGSSSSNTQTANKPQYQFNLGKQVNNLIGQRFRQASCAQIQQYLNSQGATASASDQKKLNGLNILYDGVGTYVVDNSLVVTNYASLSATVTGDQTTASTNIKAISAPTLNCTDNSSSVQTADKGLVENFESSINTANSSLRTYQKDLYQLLNAVLSS